MLHDITILGSGLAAVTAAKVLLESGVSVNMVSSHFRKNKKVSNKNYHSVRYADEEELDNFRSYNNLKTKNFYAFGSNALGGLSKYWGGGYIIEKTEANGVFFDHEYFLNRFNLQNENKSGLKNQFFSLVKNSSIGMDLIVDEAKTLNDLKTKKIYNAYTDLESLKSYKKFSLFSDCFVKNISKNSEGLFEIFVKNKPTPLLKTKKLVLACGTIGTTRILLEYLGLQGYPVRMKHNPHLAIIGMLKKKIKNKKKFVAGEIVMHSKKFTKKDGYAGFVGLLSDDIIDLLGMQVPKFLRSIFKLILKKFKSHFYVANCFLNDRYSKTFITLNNDILLIEGGVEQEFYRFKKQTKKSLKNFFSSFSFFSLFIQMPIGTDIHYTQSITKKNHNLLGVEEDFSLAVDRNIFIIDGSILENKTIYPGLYIINNALKFAKHFISRSVKKTK